MKRRILLIVILVGFLLIPTVCGTVTYLASGQPTCPPNYDFLKTCVIGTNILLSIATGGIVWAVIVIAWLLREIFRKNK